MPHGDNRRTLILAAAVVTLVCVTLAAVSILTWVSTHPGEGYDQRGAVSPVILIGSATAFALVSVNQLLGMLRGTLSDKAADQARAALSEKIDQRFDGGLDDRIRAAVARAVAAEMEKTCDQVKAVARQLDALKAELDAVAVRQGLNPCRLPPPPQAPPPPAGGP